MKNPPFIRAFGDVLIQFQLFYVLIIFILASFAKYCTIPVRKYRPLLCSTFCLTQSYTPYKENMRRRVLEILGKLCYMLF